MTDLRELITMDAAPRLVAAQSVVTRWLPSDVIAAWRTLGGVVDGDWIPDRPGLLLSDILSFLYFKQPELAIAANLAKHGADVWAFQFSRDLPGVDGALRTVHTTTANPPPGGSASTPGATTNTCCGWARRSRTVATCSGPNGTSWPARRSAAPAGPVPQRPRRTRSSCRAGAVRDRRPGRVPTANGWRIEGTKLWTTGADFAHAIVLLARTDPPNRTATPGCPQFVVDLPHPHVSIRPIGSLGGSCHFNEVHFDGAEISHDALPAPEARAGGRSPPN